MNLSLYAAIDRIGLALAVTLEFLGPLTVAIAGSRRVLDIACAVLAGVGVVVLTNPGPTTDIIGITLALLAATAWGSYILLNRTLGQRLPGLHGTAVASLVTAAAWTPIAVAWFAFHAPTAAAITLAAACGLMSSIVPYVADYRPTSSTGPDVRHLHQCQSRLGGPGRLGLLHQDLDLGEWIGIGLIIPATLWSPHGDSPRLGTRCENGSTQRTGDGGF